MTDALAPGIQRVTRDELLAWGDAVGRHLSPGAVVLLQGDVGAGKTTLAQAVARGVGVVEPVTSPTFTLVHEYDTPRGLVRHFDLYRLRGPAELDTLGWDELMADDAISLIEWPERAAGRWPRSAWLVVLEAPADAPDVRDVHVSVVA